MDEKKNTRCAIAVFSKFRIAKNVQAETVRKYEFLIRYACRIFNEPSEVQTRKDKKKTGKNETTIIYETECEAEAWLTRRETLSKRNRFTSFTSMHTTDTHYAQCNVTHIINDKTHRQQQQKTRAQQRL